MTGHTVRRESTKTDSGTPLDLRPTCRRVRPRRQRSVIIGAALLSLFPASASAQTPIALVGVNVIPMDVESVLTDHTVLVEGDRIVALGPSATVDVPADALRIDGGGAFVAPGLADMHVHFLRDESELLLYVANGVTTVRELSGEPLYLRWREEISARDRVGPNMYISGAIIDGARGRRATAVAVAAIVVVTLGLFLGLAGIGRVVGGSRWQRSRKTGLVVVLMVAGAVGWLVTRTIVPFPGILTPPGPPAQDWTRTHREVSHAVRAAAQRFDQVKLYENLPAGQFFTALAAADGAGVRTVGHVPFAVGFEPTIYSGLDELAHVYFLVDELLATGGQGDGVPEPEQRAAYRERLGSIVEQVRRSGIDVTTTLTTLPEILELVTDSAAYTSRGYLRYRTPEARDAFRALMEEGPTTERMSWLVPHVQWGREAVRLLVEAGVPMALGTDASPAGSLAGFSVHDELAELVGAGLTNADALRAATLHARRVVEDADWGLVAVGHRADLVLVEQNPLIDLTTLRQPRGVMVAGRWYDQADLRELRVTVERQRRGPPPGP